MSTTEIPWIFPNSVLLLSLYIETCWVYKTITPSWHTFGDTIPIRISKDYTSVYILLWTFLVGRKRYCQTYELAVIAGCHRVTEDPLSRSTPTTVVAHQNLFSAKRLHTIMCIIISGMSLFLWCCTPLTESTTVSWLVFRRVCSQESFTDSVTNTIRSAAFARLEAPRWELIEWCDALRPVETLCLSDGTTNFIIQKQKEYYNLLIMAERFIV